MKEKIFKTYDIRGFYPEELDERTAYSVGKALVSFFGEGSKIVVGRDGRNSSPSLYGEVIRGITEAGGDVLEIGVVSTPLLNFAVINKNSSGGIMVTASHNPPAYNGFKMIKKKGIQIYGDDIQKIKKLIKEEDFLSGKGTIEKEDMLNAYLSHIKSVIGEIDGPKVVLDYANGVASVTGKPLFDHLSIDSIHLNEKIDGNFPNYLPNPAELKNMINLQKKVVEKKADLGVFFDGDGDRAFIVDEKGEVVFPDILISLLAIDELPENKGEKVYFDLRFSRTTAEEIKKAGGVPEMLRVGNPFYKEKLIKEGGLMGAELSGHVMHKDNFSIDDGLFFALKIIKLIANKKEKLSELVKPLKRYHQSEEINMEVKNKEEVLEKVRKAFSDGKSHNIDGVYIEYKDWWFSLRESNTEDLVRLRIEAESEEDLEDKTRKIVELIKN